MVIIKEDSFLDEQSSRVWIHGDLHAQNLGTYMNSESLLVFAVNDFDEAFVGPFSWDLKRLVASIKLIGYEKALSDKDISALIAAIANSYVEQITSFATGEDSTDFSLRLNYTTGVLKKMMLQARLQSKVNHLEIFT